MTDDTQILQDLLWFCSENNYILFMPGRRDLCIDRMAAYRQQSGFLYDIRHTICKTTPHQTLREGSQYYVGSC